MELNLESEGTFTSALSYAIQSCVSVPKKVEAMRELSPYVVFLWLPT